MLLLLFVLFFVTQMKSTIFFDTVAYCQYQYYSSWERDEKKNDFTYSVFLVCAEM